MFKKPFITKPRTNIRSSSSRGVAQESKNLFPNAWDSAKQLKQNRGSAKSEESPATISVPVPVPDKLQAAKFVSHIGDKGEILYNEASEPLWLRAEIAGCEGTVLVPTVYTQWMFPAIIPILYTAPYVVEKLLNGADLMVP
ncbi:hypothetical protein GGI22_000580, partial [Coemansia erecta]